MHRVTMRSNVIELLAALTASMTVAILVLATGLAIGADPSARGETAAFAVASDGRFANPEDDDDLRPNAYVCCALIYSDPGMIP